MKTDLVEIFQTIRAQLQPYAVEGFKNKINSETEYNLCTENQSALADYKLSEIYFFGIKIKADYVVLFFTPIFNKKEIELIFNPNLLKLLKENNNFHITQLDDLLLEQVSSALKASFLLYKNKGWV